MVVVSGRKLVDDLRKRPDEELSFIEAIEEVRAINSCAGYYGEDVNIYLDYALQAYHRSRPHRRSLSHRHH